VQEVRNCRRGRGRYIHGFLCADFVTRVVVVVVISGIWRRDSRGTIEPELERWAERLYVHVHVRVGSVGVHMSRWRVMHHMARGEQAEALQGRQRRVTDIIIRIVRLSVTAERIVLRWIRVIIVLVFFLVLLSIMVALGKVLL
jgi:hypothetical protein